MPPGNKRKKNHCRHPNEAKKKKKKVPISSASTTVSTSSTAAASGTKKHHVAMNSHVAMDITTTTTTSITTAIVQKYAVGTRLSKLFVCDDDVSRTRYFSGQVVEYDTESQLYFIWYEDNDSETMTEDELSKCIADYGVGNNKESRQQQRRHIVDDGVIKKFKSCGNFMRGKEKENWQKFSNYTKLNVLDELLPATSSDDGKVVTITIPNHHRIDPSIGESSMKLTVSQKKKTRVCSLLMKRNTTHLAKGATKINIVNEEGKLLAIILRDVIPDNIARLSLKFYDDYRQRPTKFNKGCRAVAYSKCDLVLHQLKDAKSLDCAGFRTNVARLIELQPTSTGKNVTFKYVNREGRVITSRKFNSNLDRYEYPEAKLRETNCEPLLELTEKVYEQHLPEWIESRGCPKHQVENEVRQAMSKRKFTGVFIDQSKNKLGVHIDPFSQFPSCVFGHTNHIWDDNRGEWQRICDGGSLFFADGMFRLDYSPNDIILFDGNILHGVTNLKAKGNQKEDQTQPYTRFSIQLFSKHNRSQAKRYGSYDNKDLKWN